MRFPSRPCIAAGAFLLAGSLGNAQGTLADYQRGQELARKTQGLVVDAPGAANWIGETGPFLVYRSRSRAARNSSWWMPRRRPKNLPSITKSWPPRSPPPAARNTPRSPYRSPFRKRPGRRRRSRRRSSHPSPLTFVDGERSIRFGTGGVHVDLLPSPTTPAPRAARFPLPAPAAAALRRRTADDTPPNR